MNHPVASLGLGKCSVQWLSHKLFLCCFGSVPYMCRQGNEPRISFTNIRDPFLELLLLGYPSSSHTQRPIFLVCWIESQDVSFLMLAHIFHNWVPPENESVGEKRRNKKIPTPTKKSLDHRDHFNPVLLIRGRVLSEFYVLNKLPLSLRECSSWLGLALGSSQEGKMSKIKWDFASF